MATMASLKWSQLTNWRVNILCHPNFTTVNSTLSLIAFELATILLTNNKVSRDYTKLYINNIVFPKQILLHDQISYATGCYFELSACSLSIFQRNFPCTFSESCYCAAVCNSPCTNITLLRWQRWVWSLAMWSSGNYIHGNGHIVVFRLKSRQLRWIGELFHMRFFINTIKHNGW